MFYNSMFNNKQNKGCCFKVVYDVCVTPSYYFEEEKQNNNCNCKNSYNRQENYYNEPTFNEYKKDEIYERKENNCNCRNNNRCCWFKTRCW